MRPGPQSLAPFARLRSNRSLPAHRASLHRSISSADLRTRGAIGEARLARVEEDVAVVALLFHGEVEEARVGDTRDRIASANTVAGLDERLTQIGVDDGRDRPAAACPRARDVELQLADDPSEPRLRVDDLAVSDCQHERPSRSDQIDSLVAVSWRAASRLAESAMRSHTRRAGRREGRSEQPVSPEQDRTDGRAETEKEPSPAVHAD